MMGARLTIVLPPQITPAFPESLGAYNHLRYMYGYFPSTSDIVVLLGVFALGLWMVILAGGEPLPRNSIARVCTGRRCIVMTLRSKKKNPGERQPMDRRDFLRSTAFLGGTGLLSGMARPVFAGLAHAQRMVELDRGESGPHQE